jgi:hypothetical protein
MNLLRSADRFVTRQPGIESRHCFSAGPHYDPSNLSFGPLLGFDEHVIEPGAGFDEHAHARVEIVSWVLAGHLQHSSTDGADRVIGPRELFAQETGSGIRHVERNASSTEPLHLVQVTVSAGTMYWFEPLDSDAQIDAPLIHAYVVSGLWTLGAEFLVAGDSVRAEHALSMQGSGELLVLCMRDW